MKLLAGLSIVLVLSVFCPPDIDAYQDYWGISVSPSARINGMGEAGVALVNQDSFWYNPASLGFWAETHRLTASFFPIRSNYGRNLMRGRNHQFLSAIGSLVRQRGKSRSPVSVGLAAFRTDLEIEGCCAAGYNTKVDAISLGIALSGDFSFGAGVTYKSANIRSPWNDWFEPTVVVTGDAFDLGLMLGLVLFTDEIGEGDNRTGLSVPFRIGVSWSNLGGSLVRQGGAEVGYNSMARVRRTGLSLGMSHTSRGFEDISVLLAFEYEEMISDQWSPRPMVQMGVELAFGQLVTLRGGKVSEEGRSGIFSTGFTLSTRGLTRRLVTAGRSDGDGGVRGLLGKLAVEFSSAYYSKKEYSSLSNSTYRSLEVQWLF